jgi:glucokinase
MTTSVPKAQCEGRLVGGSAGPPPFPWLVADVGATRARFGWVDGDARVIQKPQCSDLTTHAGPLEAARNYLSGIEAALGPRYRAPRWAAMAIAAPVQDDIAILTNSPWRFDRLELAAGMDLEGLALINDFEALARSLPLLRPEQFRADRMPMPLPGALAVVGPGTGLGVAGIVPSRSTWVPVPGEGGHATLSPSDEFESAVLSRVRMTCGHVSAERLLSGIGLPVLHQAVADVLAMEATDLSPAEIVDRAMAREDAACDRSIDLFCALLGGFCGNVALTLGARGGLFIGGGIVPRLGERFWSSAFREKFEAKGRFRDYLQAIPTALITDTYAALAGAAAVLECR